MHKEILKNFETIGFEHFYGDYFDSRIFISYLLKKDKTSNILDIGCGAGTLLSCMPGCFKVGMDINFEFLKTAKKFNKELELIQADAQFLPFKDKTFSTISAMHLFPVINNFKGDWEKSIFETNRISNHNAVIYITGANRTSKYFEKTHSEKHRKKYLNVIQQKKILEKYFSVKIEGYGPHSKYIMYPFRIIYKIPNILLKKFKIEKIVFGFLKSKRYLKNGRSYFIICKKE